MEIVYDHIPTTPALITTTHNRENNMRSKIRKINAVLLCPFMKITGFRFSRNYRWEVTKFHSIVYRYVDTVGANIKAEKVAQ